MSLSYHTPLSVDQLRTAGIAEPWTFGQADRVRFGELDALGHVNHTQYLRWCESVRLPYLADRGITHYTENDPVLVLRSVSARYIAPMFQGEDYIVTARTRSFRTASFTMEYGIFSGDLRAEVSAVIVLLNRNSDGRFTLTDAMKRSLVEKDGAIPEG